MKIDAYRHHVKSVRDSVLDLDKDLFDLVGTNNGQEPPVTRTDGPMSSYDTCRK